MRILFLINIVFLSFPAQAAPDCSPNMRAKGLYQCESQSHEGSADRPRKECSWNRASKECTCCIFNDEEAEQQVYDDREPGEQE